VQTYMHLYEVAIGYIVCKEFLPATPHARRRWRLFRIPMHQGVLKKIESTKEMNLEDREKTLGDFVQTLFSENQASIYEDLTEEENDDEEGVHYKLTHNGDGDDDENDGLAHLDVLMMNSLNSAEA